MLETLDTLRNLDIWRKKNNISLYMQKKIYRCKRNTCTGPYLVYFWTDLNEILAPYLKSNSQTTFFYFFSQWRSFDEFTTPQGAPCFRIGGAEDNFIFYIEYCFFFVPVMKLRWEYNILNQFQSISCLMFEYMHIFPRKLCDLVKNRHFVHEKPDCTLLHDFQFPNHLDLHKMNTI